MASGKPTQDPPALNATRQMLDELDALMERMLAVPIAEPEEPAPPQAAAPQPRSRPMAATLTLLQVPTDETPVSFRPPTESAPATPAFDPAHAGTNPSHLPALGALGSSAAPAWSEMAGYPSLTYPPAPVSEPYPELPALPASTAVTPEPLSFRVLPSASEPSLDELLADVPEPPASLAAWFILPLLWGNRLFDQGTMLFGESGSWLRGPIGRSALGMAGLILFGAALLWLARDWLGWTW
jgi:hypothetical protein